MALESPCVLRVGREQFEGTATLDADHIDFAGATKFRFRFTEIKSPGERNGELTFLFHGHPVRMNLRFGGEKWLKSILHPKTVAEKLGITSGCRVRFVNFEDHELERELDGLDAKLLNGDGNRTSCDMVLMSAERPAELTQFGDLAKDVGPSGAIWVVLPKTSKNITHANVLAAAREAGLVDSETISYSETMSAYRVAVPTKRRRPATSKRRATKKRSPVKAKS